MADIAFEKDLSVTETGIEGLKVVDLAVHGDNRGWFKENWQRAKMCALGIPDLRIVQNNISYNDRKGVTRGIHAEPWDKFISVARGSVFGAWVDLREGSETYGKVFTCTLDPSKAIYVPRGVGNSFQALEDGTAYTYLVDAHWSLELKKTYTFVNLADPELAIEWPIPLDEATVSEADLNHPMLADVVPMAPKRTLVTGCNGQLGHAVRRLAEERGVAKDFDFCDIDTFDMSDPDAYAQYDWSLYGTVINCGAYTAVDRAETPEGRATAWKLGALSQALYVGLGLVGLPIFAAGGGFSYVFNPTFGFLLGLIPAAWVIGLLTARRPPHPIRTALACLAGLAVLYAVGLPYMAVILNQYMGKAMDFSAILWAGMLPFLPGDMLKIAVTAALAPLLQKRLSAAR